MFRASVSEFPKYRSVETKKAWHRKSNSFPTALDVPVSEVKRSNEELKQLISLPPQRTVSRTALLGMIAAKEAMKDAGLTPPLRIGFISATSVGGMDLSEHFYESFKKTRDRDGYGK